MSQCVHAVIGQSSRPSRGVKTAAGFHLPCWWSNRGGGVAAKGKGGKDNGVNFRAVAKRRVGTGSHSQRSTCIDFYAANIDMSNSTKFKSAFLFEKYCFPPPSPHRFPLRSSHVLFKVKQLMQFFITRKCTYWRVE
jgi:hypothetical protein